MRSEQVKIEMGSLPSFKVAVKTSDDSCSFIKSVEPLPQRKRELKQKAVNDRL
jgi:hypothetical protein